VRERKNENKSSEHISLIFDVGFDKKRQQKNIPSFLHFIQTKTAGIVFSFCRHDKTPSVIPVNLYAGENLFSCGRNSISFKEKINFLQGEISPAQIHIF
jgi:hypothetical protein